jgi:hypothetical protein
MRQKKDDYYDNINDMANADYKTIMLKAKTKYDMLLSSTDRPFGSPSKKEQHMIALQAELNEVKDSNLKLSKQLKSKLKSPAPGTNVNKVTSSPQRTKNSKNNSDRRRQKQDEAWKKVAPKSGEPKTLKKDNKTWNWCIHHLAWCLHTSTDCRKGKDMLKQAIAHQSITDNESYTGHPTSLLAHLAELSMQDE